MSAAACVFLAHLFGFVLLRQSHSSALTRSPASALPPVRARSPQAGFDGAVAAGTKKAGTPAKRIFGLGMLSGAHIGFGAFLMLSVGGACPGLAATNPGLKMIISGAFGLPFGLIMTLVTGGELFTGNTALVGASFMEGKTTKGELAKSWIGSYAGNLVGSLFLAYLAFHGGTLGAGPASAAVATAKCANTFSVAFVRGLMCNWLVCMADYMASGCSSMAGKMTAVWFPISAFIALGLEHSVANMFLIPLGMLRGAEVTIADFLMKNLLPVTLGNIVGGMLCVMAPFGSSFGGWFKKED